MCCRKFDAGRAGPLLARGLNDPEALVRARAVDGLVRLSRTELGGAITELAGE